MEKAGGSDHYRAEGVNARAERGPRKLNLFPLPAVQRAKASGSYGSRPAAPAKAGEVAAFPAVRLADLDGKTLTRQDLAGRVVLVEFWATSAPLFRRSTRRPAGSGP
jgi:hypothetical protein